MSVARQDVKRNFGKTLNIFRKPSKIKKKPNQFKTTSRQCKSAVFNYYTSSVLNTLIHSRSK